MRASARGSLTALVLLLLVAVASTPAAAHLYLVSSQPADGAHLDAVPQEIRLRFSEPVELALTRVQLLGPDGSPVRLAELSVSAGEPNVLVVLIEDTMVPGPHSIAWRTTSADGHPVSGRIGFTVDEEADGLAVLVADEPPAVSPVHHDPSIFPEANGFSAESPGYVVVRWLTFIGLLGVIGAASFKLFVLGRVGRQPASETHALLGPATLRAATFGLTFSFVLVVAVLARLYAQSIALHGAGTALDTESISTLLGRTTWGIGWILQATATAIALLGFSLARLQSHPGSSEATGEEGYARQAVPSNTRVAAVPATADGGDPIPARSTTDVVADEAAARHGQDNPHRGSGPRIGWALASLGALVLAFTPALGGHAVATPGLTGLAVLSDGLHVLGAGGWLGSLLAVVTIGIPAAMRLGRQTRGKAVAVLVNAFSPTALLFAGIVTMTGILSATFHLGSVADLWQSDYGRTLVLKVGVLSLLFGTGAYNWRRVRPALGDERGAHRLRRSAGFELAVGGVVLLVTAVLVATPPPMDSQASAEHTAVETVW